MKSGLDRIADAKAQLEKCERDRDIFNAELKTAFEERRDEWFTRKGRLLVNVKRIAFYFTAFFCSLIFLMIVTSFNYVSNLGFWVVTMLFTAAMIVAGELVYAPKRKRALDASRYYAENVSKVQDVRAAVQNAQQGFRQSSHETFSSVLKQSFDHLYVEKESIDALRFALKAKEKEYPSSCRIQSWPSDSDSGLKEKIEAMTLSIAFRELLEKCGIGKQFAELL